MTEPETVREMFDEFFAAGSEESRAKWFGLCEAHKAELIGLVEMALRLATRDAVAECIRQHVLHVLPAQDPTTA